MVDLDKVVSSLKKNFKSTSLVSNSEDPTDLVSTGNLALDLSLDGGVVFGVGTEMIGLSASGKSLLCQKITANAQEKYGAVGIVIDKENAWTKARCAQLGIDTSLLFKAHTSDTITITDAYKFIFSSIEEIRKQDKNCYIVITIDSVGAFGKDVAIDKSDSGRRAKDSKDGYRELFGYLDNKIMILIVNHFYYKIGASFGDPRVASGGEGWKYFNSIRIALEDRKKIVDDNLGGEVVGNWIGAEIIKTRFGSCYRNCYLQHYYKTGIDYYSGYARLLADKAYLTPTNKSGFKAFNTHTLSFEVDEVKEQVNENRILSFLDRHPELLFNTYPEYNESKDDKKDKEEDGDNETDD